MTKHKFTFDKAEWQWKSALDIYLNTVDKKTEDLNDHDISIIWENCANHISIFLTWLINNDLLSKIHRENIEDILKVEERRMTGYEFLAKNCDMVLSREDLSRKIVKFTDYFYEEYIDMYCNYVENNLHRKVLGIGFSWKDYDEISLKIIEPNYKTYINNKSK